MKQVYVFAFLVLLSVVSCKQQEPTDVLDLTEFGLGKVSSRSVRKLLQGLSDDFPTFGEDENSQNSGDNGSGEDENSQDSGGDGSGSSPPSSPSINDVSINNNGDVQIEFSTVSDATSYQGEALPSGSDPSNVGQGVGITSSSSGSSPVVISSSQLTPGQSYDFYVIASNDAGSTPSSGVSFEVPQSEQQQQQGPSQPPSTEQQQQQQGPSQPPSTETRSPSSEGSQPSTESATPSSEQQQSSSPSSESGTGAPSSEQPQASGPSSETIPEIATNPDGSIDLSQLAPGAEETVNRVQDSPIAEGASVDATTVNQLNNQVGNALASGDTDAAATAVSNTLSQEGNILNAAVSFASAIARSGTSTSEAYAQSFAQATVGAVQSGDRTLALRCVSSTAVAIAFSYASGNTAGATAAAQSFAFAISASGSCGQVIASIIQAFLSIIISLLNQRSYGPVFYG